MNNDIPKLAPIRDWDLAEVWAYLTTQKHFNVEPLISLYSVNPRFGCWHCTLASHRVRRTTNPYYDAVRLIYRSVTDLFEFRTVDAKRHKVTSLNEYGRYVIWKSLELAEKMSGKRLFYGLDYAKVKSYSQIYTLRELFYELPCKDADKIIRSVDDSDRFISMCQIRSAKPNGNMLRKLLWWSRFLVNNLPDNDPIIEALNNIINNL
jgi:DNA sulfur modification protein DndC